MVTQKEIAKLLGISRTTVARAINGSPLIKDETKEKVMKLIKEMKYEKNIVGSSLAIRKNKKVYAFIIKSKNEFYTKEIIYGLKQAREEYKSYNYTIEIITTNINDSQSQIETLKKVLEKDDVDGLIITPLEKEKVYEIIEPHLDKIKVVSLGIKLSDNIYHVGPDHVKQGKIAAGIMNVILRENEKLLIINNGDDKISSKEYLEGFLEKAKEGKTDIVGPLYAGGIENSISMIKKICDEQEIKGIYINRYAQDIYQKMPKEFFKDKKIVASGISETVKEMIKDKIIIAAIMEEVSNEGYTSGKRMFELLYKGIDVEKGKWEISKSHIIFYENLEDYVINIGG
ncbi:LacI family DNA-binding transcriptional regulator [Fusobacterium sp.]|uniref:substrate-binding domain-containing protein n=1 Tax=Fusobacterium sp. TaxID=68766 RepID=UPI00260425D2|nr:LacI family DNA-binding transcriptional regulator [Fusobacterium sp.]